MENSCFPGPPPAPCSPAKAGVVGPSAGLRPGPEEALDPKLWLTSVSSVDGGSGGPQGLQESGWAQARAGGRALPGTAGALGGQAGLGLRNELESQEGREGHTEASPQAPSQSPMCS